MKKFFLITSISIISVIVLFFLYNVLQDRKLTDSGLLSKVLLDSELFDTELADSELLDSELLDTELLDSELLDSESLDSELLDSESLDTELTDSELLDNKSYSPESDYGKLDIIELESSIKILNNNMPYFSEEDKKRLDSFEIYSELDHLGRCGVAYANISIETMPTVPRGEIGNIKPSGWHTVKYSDIIKDRYLYNRCHLIAYQLAGENANERNLITGTRYLNTCGMLPFENRVSNYVKETGNHVLYRVTPVFKDDNLVADGVEIEAWSVEDNGQGICFNVFCSNMQPYIVIDYATGESWPSDSVKANAEEIQYDYIININTGKFHYPACKFVNDIAVHNRKGFYGDSHELEALGYSPCKNCHK